MHSRSLVFSILGIVLGMVWIALSGLGCTNQGLISETIQEPITQEPVAVESVSLAAVLPHHNLVQARRVQFFQQLSAIYQPATIILISPNHFNSGSGNVLTTDRTWKVQNGITQLEPDLPVINQLVGSQLAVLDDTAFDSEHGITNLIGEVKQFFPNAQFVPIIFKESTAPEHVQELVTLLTENCTDCGVIASVDMSHYKTAAVANANDAVTIQALTNLDHELIWNTDVDSHASLEFLMQWADQHGSTHFNLVDHTNSGELVGNPDIETTSHIFGYYTP